MKKEYIIAYDCGTTALKTVLISSDGTVIGDARADVYKRQHKNIVPI